MTDFSCSRKIRFPPRLSLSSLPRLVIYLVERDATINKVRSITRELKSF